MKASGSRWISVCLRRACICCLEQLIEWRGKPRIIRSDNGSEMCNGEFHASTMKRGIRLMLMQPGKPTQNACIEGFDRKIRHEWLYKHSFESIEHAQQTATQRPWRYDRNRRIMTIGEH